MKKKAEKQQLSGLFSLERRVLLVYCVATVGFIYFMAAALAQSSIAY